MAHRFGSPRTRKIADQIQREIADLIRLEVKDPRVRMVTLTGVEVSPDHEHARIFFTALADSAAAAAETERALQHAAGFLRFQLAHRVHTRSVPQLHFVYDISVERGARLSKLIDDATKSPSDGSES